MVRTGPINARTISLIFSQSARSYTLSGLGTVWCSGWRFYSELNRAVVGPVVILIQLTFNEFLERISDRKIDGGCFPWMA